MEEYSAESKEWLDSKSIVRDPEKYSEWRCPKRYGRRGTETRRAHIWHGHKSEFREYGYESFEEVLPDLVDIAENPESTELFDEKRGNKLFINPEKNVVVVTREVPFRRSRRYKDATTQPPLPPVIVTAFTLSNPEKADRIIAKHTGNIEAGV